MHRYRAEIEVVFMVAAFFVLLPYLGRLINLLSVIGPEGTILLVCAILLHFGIRHKKELINF